MLCSLRNFGIPVIQLLAVIAMIATDPGAHLLAADKEPLRVCLLSGCPTYQSEQSLPPFQEWLEKNYSVQCTRISRDGHTFPDLEKLADCDVTFIFFKRMNLEGRQLEMFREHVRSGKAIVAVRTASHAVQTWLEFDREILGGNYQGHYEKEPDTVIELTEVGRTHPILQGIQLKSAPGPLYKNSGHAEDITVLLTGSNPGQKEPLAWTREVNKGRVFYTSLGNVETFNDEQFRRMLANALFWTAGRDPVP